MAIEFGVTVTLRAFYCPSCYRDYAVIVRNGDPFGHKCPYCAQGDFNAMSNLVSARTAEIGKKERQIIALCSLISRLKNQLARSKA